MQDQGHMQNQASQVSPEHSPSTPVMYVYLLSSEDHTIETTFEAVSTYSCATACSDTKSQPSTSFSSRP